MGPGISLKGLMFCANAGAAAFLLGGDVDVCCDEEPAMWRLGRWNLRKKVEYVDQE